MEQSFRKYYEKEAEHVRRYDSTSFWDMRYHVKRKRSIMSILESLLHVGTFLDVGCGSGEYLFEVSKFCDEPIGLDISSTYLRRIKRTNKEFSLIQADAQALPLKDKCIDHVLCSETIEHLQNPEIAIYEISRVARIGFIISTPNYGLLRMAMNKISRSSVTKLDKSVGHVNILPLFQLREKILKSKCKIKLEKTLHVTPPNIGEGIHLPPKLSLFIDKLELILEKIFPKSGNISIMECDVLLQDSV
jgi:ubiquinone/menaquinone biosynthesis C-methylase UbiE